MNYKKVQEILQDQYDINQQDTVNYIIAACKQNKLQKIKTIIPFTKQKKFQKFVKELQQICIQFRFPINLQALQNQKYLYQNVIGILAGPCGHGKTQIFNHICGKNYKTSQSSSSLSRDIILQSSISQFDRPFFIIDSPGTTSTQYKYMHAAYLKQAFTFKPVNTIFFIVKCSSRYQQVLNACKRQSLILEGYQNKIVFLLTHFDHLKDKKKFYKSFNEMLDKNNIKNQVLYFSSLHIQSSYFSKILYLIAKNMKQQKIQITKEKFYKNFQIKLNDQQVRILDHEMKKYIDIMQKIKNQYVQIGNTCKNQQDKAKQAIFHDLSMHLKRQLQDVVSKFSQYLNTYQLTTIHYEYYYYLQSQILAKVTAFQQSMKFMFKGALLNHSTGQKDIRDLIKQCPNPSCGLVWMRVQSCPNTQCGRKPSCFFDYFTVEYNYVIKLVNGKRVLNKNKIESKTKQNKQSSNQSGKGCGRAMDFNSLPRLGNIQQILKQWYSADSFQQVIARFQQTQKIKNELKKKVEYNTKKSVNKMNEQYNNILQKKSQRSQNSIE